MNEREYIATGDIVRLRLALELVGCVVCHSELHEMRRQALHLITSMVAHLEPLAEITEEQP